MSKTLWLAVLLQLLALQAAHAQSSSGSVPSIEDLQKQLNQKKTERESRHHARAPAEPAEARRANELPGFRDCPDCPEMIRLAAGGFTMGSPPTEPDRDKNEGPQHSVTLPAFYLGKYDITFDEWDACAAANACSRHPDDKGWGRGRHPVIDVSWEDVQQYLTWLSGKAGHAYRLPSEAEWEYAARAGTGSAYWWGDDIGAGRAACKGCGSQWDGKGTAPVGSFAPNPWDLYEMLGNVSQWTADCWHDDYSGAPADGSAWEDKGSSWIGSGGCGRRVARGGSKDDKPRDLRAAARVRMRAGSRDNFRGFRVARSE
jgi:formylglycine-generating enzyme required for sulfatase activity